MKLTVDKSMPRYAIVIVSDANLFPAAFFLAYRLAVLNKRQDLQVVLLTDSDRDIAIAGQRRWPFLVERIDAELPAVAVANAHVTAATYYRIFLPRLLGSRYERLLYLDVDTYLHSAAVYSVFDLAMHSYAIAAARDIMIAYSIPTMAELHEALPTAAPKYLQAGVLLIDCERFNKEGLEKHLVGALTASGKRLRYDDQTALNRVLDGNWLELSPSFNMQPAEWNSFVPLVYPTAIVHFAGSVKPWHGSRFTMEHPVRGELERFISQTPWSGFLARFHTEATAARGEARQQHLGWTAFDREGVVKYLRETSFADVEQGLTKVDLSRWPASA